MKLSIKTVTALIFTLGISTYSFSQEMAAVKNAQVTAVSNSETDYNSTETVAETSFSTLFPNASQVKWTAASGNSFVSFLNKGRKARASFSSNGQMNYVITDCEMNHLPAAFSKTIGDKYASYKLFNAIEIKAHGATAYQAILESSNSFVTLKYTEDGVEQIQQLKK